MKRAISCMLLLLLLTGIMPFFCLLRGALSGSQAKSRFADTAKSEPSQDDNAESRLLAPGEESAVILLDSDTGEVFSVSVREYLIGAAASEMPADWPDQAILAQMVACHSNLLYQKNHADTTALSGAWLAVAPARRQGYSPEEVLRSFWGDAFEANHARFAALADEVLTDVFTYSGEPAATCYHAISCGHTESSQNVWGEALPYLQGVDSSSDKDAEGYANTLTYSTQQMYDALVMNLGLSPEGEPESWFGETNYDDAGYVNRIFVTGTEISGIDFRTALSLRSACFAVSFEDDEFHILTHGYGHGVGMSQWGAKVMAEAGSGWPQILQAYFPGCTPDKSV